MFYFKNDATQIYISSADWMPRNLVRRIELLTAIKDNVAKEKILQVLQLQCSDNTLAHELQSDGTYIKVKRDPSSRAVNNHKLLEDYVNRISKATKKETANTISKLAARLYVES